MECPNCGRSYQGKECPFCKKENTIYIQLPNVKKINEEYSDEKTQAISYKDNTETPTTTLEDDIIKEMDYEEAKPYDEKKHEHFMEEFEAYEENQIENRNLKRNDKQKYLIIVVLVLLIVLAILLINLVTSSNKEYDYVSNTSSSLNEVYIDKKNTNLKELLTNIKDDESKKTYVQSQSKEKVDNWIDSLYSKDLTSLDRYKREYKELLKSINLLHTTSVDGYTCLPESEYELIISSLEKNNKEAVKYYEGIDYINKKEYNNAYYLFKEIEVDSKLYNKSLKQKEIITLTVISDLKSEIDKLIEGIDTLTEEEKKIKYEDVVALIKEYNTTYEYLELSNNQEYNSLLQEYKEYLE